MIRVMIYNEYLHEQTEEKIRAIYPDGIHGQLKKALAADDLQIRTVTLQDLPQGLSKEVLDETDVLLWWGHMGHQKVPDETVDLVKQAVLDGMGMVFLHSGHHSKPFRALMGTSGNLTWREDGDRALVWTITPSHPIAQGIGRFILIDHEETYGEPFVVPEPEETVFITNYSGGEVFRSGMTWKRGNGKIFYFQPGHESFPIYYHPDVIKVIRNAIHWANPVCRTEITCPHVKKPLEGNADETV